MVNIPRLMIASAMSGGGKTTAICAILSVLEKRGLKASSFKCGPDYIDPMYHRVSNGRVGVNLDLFFSSENEVKDIFTRNSLGYDISVVEGVMGYYDGMSMDSANASSYAISRLLGIPTVIVIPARGMAYTTVAIIKGILEFKSDSNIKAVVLNGVTEMTFKMLKSVIERETGVCVLGYIPKLEYSMESRHLGLVLPHESKETTEIINKTADVISKTLDFDKLLEIAADVKEIDCNVGSIYSEAKVKIGVAYDKTFCFYYKENIEMLKSMGAEIVYFSPIDDESIPHDVSGVIFGGGYPELYADKLSKNTDMLNDVKNKISSGMPCIAECGGFMYLHNEIQCVDGNMYAMAGVIDATAVKKNKLVRFGYKELTSKNDNAFLNKGEKIKSHEFHYWDSTDNGKSCTASRASGKTADECVHINGNMFAGFPHLYFGSNRDFVKNFIENCVKYGDNND